MRRNDAVDRQLASCGLTTVNVAGDGNCMFRAASYALYGHERSHLDLRKSVADCIESNGSFFDVTVDKSPDDNNDFLSHLQELRRVGVSVGEDAIIALAHVTGRPIRVHVAFIEPLMYQPRQCTSALPVELAFFEPGHYKAVVQVNSLN